jgi:hypothetical protein
MRLARLHGRDAGAGAGPSDARRLAAVAAAQECLARPALRLEGERPA